MTFAKGLAWCFFWTVCMIGCLWGALTLMRIVIDSQ